MTPGSGARDHQGDHVEARFDVPADWDERYASADQLWSGAPNAALVDAAERHAPGRAVDVGCGEGADAVWLARRGWQVVGLDVSGVALERAARHAAESEVAVHWLHAGLLDAGLEPASFDLVSAQYPVLLKTSGSVAERILIDSVAPGGLLAFVHHADFQQDDPAHHGFNPGDYVGPWNIRPLLGNDWRIEVDEVRPRDLASGAGAHHTEDVVLIARRLH
jgi:SAM-dependent methyltransferase